MALDNPDKCTYRVIWSEEDQSHVGLCAEFPSLSHLAGTSPEALAGIMKLVGTVVSEMVKSKEDDLDDADRALLHEALDAADDIQLWPSKHGPFGFTDAKLTVRAL